MAEETLLSMTEFAELLSMPMLTEKASVVSGSNLLLVQIDEIGDFDALRSFTTTDLPTCPVIGFGSTHHDLFDLVTSDVAAKDLLCNNINAQPQAASVLVQLLRHNVAATVEQGLFAESLAYSSLQHSQGFHQWLANRTSNSPASSSATQPPVLVERQSNVLHLSLNRPSKRNAYSAAMRDALCEALQIALVDGSIQHIRLSGVGEAFCAGGDLDEFGTARDAGAAHLARTTRSAAKLLNQLADRVEVWVHGACIGAGIELPAFAGKVSAHKDAFFQLPEVSMGLVPGAGGTASITRRIGRQNTGHMAISNQRIRAPQALEWGLIDAIET